MTAHTTDLTEEGRAFLQERVALFAKVMIGAQVLGLAGLLVLNPWEQLRQPWFALYQVQTGLAVGAWLLCRGGVRSVRFVSWVEVTMLLGTAAVSATISRLIVPGLMPQFLGSVVSPSDAAYGRVVGVVEGTIFLEFVIGLSLWVFVRAALVPSRGVRTLVLTALVAVPLVAVTVMRTFPFEPEPSLRSLTPDDLVVTNVLNTVIWWSFITGVCTIVSAVIFGLRRQVRDAKQLGQYTLLEKVGEGGMGEVYRARHSRLRRSTAVKLLPASRSSEEAVARFESEVQLTAQLTHPNTIRIYDYGRTEDGVFYYAMEHLDGVNLREVVEIDGPQPVARVIKILEQTAGALQEAHAAGLIHRDIKPANIMLTRQGIDPDTVKVLDFGLVRPIHGREDGELTQAGALLGTPLYMAPEVINGSDNVGPASDLYALGAVGYFLATGTHVFPGATLMEMCSHHLRSTPEPMSERLGAPVAADFEAVVMQCLAKRPADRAASAAALIGRLRECKDHGRWAPVDADAWWTRCSDALDGRASDLWSSDAASPIALTVATP
jgi:serine/threonine-protein kinase